MDEKVRAARALLVSELESKRTKERHKRIRLAAEAYFKALDAEDRKVSGWSRLKGFFSMRRWDDQAPHASGEQ